MPPGFGLCPRPEVYHIAAASTALVWEPHATQTDFLYPFHQYGGEYSFGGLAESLPIPVPSLHLVKGFSFPGYISPGDMVDPQLVVSIKPGDFNVMICHQVYEFTNTWLVEHFVAQSHLSWVH